MCLEAFMLGANKVPSSAGAAELTALSEFMFKHFTQIHVSSCNRGFDLVLKQQPFLRKCGKLINLYCNKLSEMAFHSPLPPI